jgi:hypothetical protein
VPPSDRVRPPLDIARMHLTIRRSPRGRSGGAGPHIHREPKARIAIIPSWTRTNNPPCRHHSRTQKCAPNLKNEKAEHSARDVIRGRRFSSFGQMCVGRKPPNEERSPDRHPAMRRKLPRCTAANLLDGERPLTRLTKTIALIFLGLPLGGRGLPRPSTALLDPLLPANARFSLPLPPPLPPDPPKDYAAPVPNADLQIPATSRTSKTDFALRLYSMRQFDTSEAFPPGSAYEAPEERKPLQPPGFMVTVPLR